MPNQRTTLRKLNLCFTAVLFFTFFLNVSQVSLAQSRYKIATWNLEHFKDSADRGFPEYLDRYDPPGPKYDPRGNDEYKFIAEIIADQNFKIVALQEINGKTNSGITGNDKNSSEELNKLLSFLDPSWTYVIGESGRSQRLAFIYDTRFVKAKSFCQLNLPDEEIQDKDLFDRQPLVGHFQFLRDGQEMNDIVLVDVHLASGQDKNKNHDEAMRRIVRKITSLQNNSSCFAKGEKDIAILGDYNANRFGGAKEDFWNEMEGEGWDVLADSRSTYGATRLSGSPLGRRNSIIDYIIISDGLKGKEVTQNKGYIHYGLIQNGPEDFRRNASDHIPVSMMVKVVPDND